MPSRTRISLVGLLALTSLAACTSASSPPPALGQASRATTATVATFEGRFDPATGKLSIQTMPEPAAASRAKRSVSQPFSDGVLGTGPDNTFELVTDGIPAPGVTANGCGPGVDAFDGHITLRSFYIDQAFSNVAIELVSASTGHEACNSDSTPADGMSNAFGLWDYGAIGVKGSGTDHASFLWSFRFAASEAFTFRGRIMAQAAPLTAPANGATSFDWTPAMFMDPPHSFQDVPTTLAHVVWNHATLEFIDTKGLLHFLPGDVQSDAEVGLTYPKQAYANGFTTAPLNYYVDLAGGAAIDMSGDFTVCAKFKPGANPAAGVFRVIAALGDPVDDQTSVGWALAHYGPTGVGAEPEYAFMYRTGFDTSATRAIYGPQGLPADPNNRAYEYVCGGREVDNVRVGTFGQAAGYDIPVSGAIPSPAALPLVIGNAATGLYPYVDGGVYEVIFDSRAPTLAFMNEIVAAAEGRQTYNDAAFVGSTAAGTTVTGADGATYVLPQGANYPVSTDASGLLDNGKSLDFGGTAAGQGPVLPSGTTDYCIGAEVTSANWAAASGCVLGWAGGGELKIFFSGGTIAGTNGGAWPALASSLPTPGRHKVMVCYRTATLGAAELYVDGTLAGTTGADGGAPFDIVAGQLQVGTCLDPGPLTGARIGRVFACPTSIPAACH